MPKSEKAVAVTWTAANEDETWHWKAAAVTAVTVDVEVWGAGRRPPDAWEPALCALTLTTAAAAEARLRPGSRILLARDQIAGFVTGALSPRFARVRKVGTHRGDRTLVHVEWVRESMHEMSGWLAVGTPPPAAEGAETSRRAPQYPARPRRTPPPARAYRMAGGEACMANTWRNDPQWGAWPTTPPIGESTAGEAITGPADDPKRPYATLMVSRAFAENAGLHPGSAIVLARDARQGAGSVKGRYARIWAIEAPEGATVEVAVEWMLRTTGTTAEETAPTPSTTRTGSER